MGVYTNTYSDQDKIQLLPWLIDALAVRHNTNTSTMFKLLLDSQALDFYDRHYAVLHTFSIEDAADSLDQFMLNHI